MQRLCRSDLLNDRSALDPDNFRRTSQGGEALIGSRTLSGRKGYGVVCIGEGFPLDVSGLRIFLRRGLRRGYADA